MNEFIKFHELHKRLAQLIEIDEGASKRTSGDIQIYFTCPFSYRPQEEQEIWIKCNGYDISSWSRHEEWGPFLSFTSALGHMTKKVEEAEADFKRDLEQSNVGE